MLVMTATSGGGDLGQRPDLSERAHAHFENGRLVPRLDPEQGEGQAEVIVVVSLGLEHLEFLGEQGGGEFLGHRFTDAARDADDFDGPLGQDTFGQGLEGLECVRH